MKFLFVSAISLVVLQFITAHRSDDKLWQEYKEKFNRKYSPREDIVRKREFLKVQNLIEKHNQAELSWTLGHNELSDRTEQERSEILGRTFNFGNDTDWDDYNSTQLFGGYPGQQHEDFGFNSTELINDRQSSIDLRTHACMPIVKSQNLLGKEACKVGAIFASITPIEFQGCVKKGAIDYLSEQQVLDCTFAQCSGGNFPFGVWAYLQWEAKPMPQWDYPYTGEKGASCKYNAKNVVDVKLGQPVPVFGEADIMEKVTSQGPVVASIFSNTKDFEFYQGGIFAPKDCKGNADHHVAIVGFGADAKSGQKYWILRNSYGPVWGQEGYMLIQRGANTCGIESDVSAVSIV